MRYASWHAALVYRVPAPQFPASIEVLPPKAPIAPWLEAQEEERAPLPNLRPARHVDLQSRRRAAPLRASPVRKIDPRDWAPPSEWRA